MRRAYLVIGWGIVLLGIIHMFAATRLFSGLTAAALWFFSGGIAMVLAGALNLLNHAYGATAPGLRRVGMGTNVVMTVFAMVTGIVTNASLAEHALVLGLVGGAAVLSSLRSVRLPGT